MKEIKIRFGDSIFVEEFGDQEEDERIKIYDSNQGYIDYIPVERIYDLAEGDGVSPEQWLLEECKDYEEAEDIWRLLDLILDEPYSTPMLWEELLKDLADNEYDIDGLTEETLIKSGHDINRIGKYYFYVG